MLTGKKKQQNNVPPILKATKNLILSDLKNLQIKAGDTINLYSLFSPGIVRTSNTVKYALDRGILVPATDEQPKPITPPTPATAPKVSQSL
jgi:hypothetical protein